MVKVSTIIRIVIFGAIVATIYWYWSGPWQERINPSYEAILEENEEKLDLCMRGAAYQQGATGTGPGADIARERCAEELNLYEENGRWHRHDIARPD